MFVYTAGKYKFHVMFYKDTEKFDWKRVQYVYKAGTFNVECIS